MSEQELFEIFDDDGKDTLSVRGYFYQAALSIDEDLYEVDAVSYLYPRHCSTEKEALLKLAKAARVFAQALAQVLAAGKVSIPDEIENEAYAMVLDAYEHFRKTDNLAEGLADVLYIVSDVAEWVAKESQPTENN